MKTWLIDQILKLALPVIVGALSFAAVKGLKRLLVVVDNAGGTAKAAIAFVTTSAITLLVKFAGDAMPAACILDAGEACVSALADPDAMKTLLAFLVATVLHHWRKNATDPWRSRSR